MPHADASLIPNSIKSKPEFWAHVYTQLESLLMEENWVTNCANATSLVYNSLLAFPAYFGDSTDKAVNWCGVYLDSSYFPRPKTSSGPRTDESARLLLGPFCGKPACQFINVTSGKARGVCADAFIQRRTVVVPNVDEYPGHIACDGETKSEIVVPLVTGVGETIGVLDLDCLALNGFDDHDKEGLEKIAKLIVDSSHW
ncbi:GAF domain-like protein [Macrolepiota fuliginosa MF-IS2]|uniref:GAF domain-like protein n=1 Tax=Macrolepiota fuliginosa MF-IS2 TaxID=1400762 RepID=A0A9P5XN60_9AGAR|nr:GAF domain-like protein [Macrolepiota fuliginosa MF-IS2]